MYDINAKKQLLVFISYYNSEHTCSRHYRSEHIVFKSRICFMFQNYLILNQNKNQNKFCIFLLLFMMIPLFHSERDIPNMIQKAHVQHLRIPKDHCVSQRFPHTAKTRAEIELKSITGVLQEAHDNAMTMKMQCYVCIVLFSFICKTHAFIHTYANIFFADVNV